MLNIVCVNASNYLGRGAEYVNILADMVGRNISDKTPYKFICFTDSPEGIDSAVDIRPLPEVGLNGWWNKLALFKDGLFPDGDRVFFLDLDTVIVGALDDIIKYDGLFAILRDFYRPNGYGSAAMAWEAGKWGKVWTSYLKAGFPDVAGGDQTWIEKSISNPDFLQDLYPGFFNSYKVSCQNIFPKNTKIVCFHGLPRPHEIMSGWVPHIWKIGGGSTLELQICGNTEDSELIKNIKDSLDLNLPVLYSAPSHKGHAVIVGGAPSLNEFIDEIAWRKSQGQTIFATNNTHKIVSADYHVMLDARPDNAAFVPSGLPCLYASQCHPDVFTRAKENKITIWHSYADGMDDVLKDEKRSFTYIGGGSSVGLKAICIAYVMGYREFHLYGFDSCYRNDQHHAYAQSLNDGERVIEVDLQGKKYKVAPWMATQVEQFKELAVQLVASGCVITTHGEGLLQDVAASMNRPLKYSDLKWPDSDIICKLAMQNASEEVDLIAGYCQGRGVAVQAGGNIGVWPIELSRHFKQVYTFEPDPDNFECLYKNIKNYPNISPQMVALGERQSMVDISKVAHNCGASYIVNNGDTPVLTIDSLGLQKCDLIQLDIEGYELAALLGSTKTIIKFHPVIVIEENGLSERYGVKRGEAQKYLEWLGYTAVLNYDRDIIFTFNQTKEGV